jgi:heavy metal sensor kinase
VKPLSLRTTLTLAYTGVLAAILTAVGFAFHAVLVRQLNASWTESLEERARGLHRYLQFANDTATLEYDTHDAEEVAFINDATRYYQLYDANTGRLIVQSPGLESLGLRYTPQEIAEIRAHPGVQDVQTDRGRLRLSSSLMTPSTGEAYVVQVGDLLDHVDAAIRGFDRLLIWQILSSLVVAAIAGRWFAGRALAPLSRLVTATQAIDIGNLDDRLAMRGADDELDAVAKAFNHTLERVERSVGEMRQFSAALAHELRTPLAILRGEAELALTQPLHEQAVRDRLVSHIEEYDRLTRLINQILTLARAESGEIAIRREPIDLSALVLSVAEQIEPVAAAREISLTCDAPPAVIVSADAGWLERLILILLDNAIKFTPKGGRVSMVVTTPNDVAQLSIEDTGTGIPPQAIPRLFERFYQVDSSRSRQTEGAGLGLALAKWIADRHDAGIRVRSKPGEGSVFTLTLRQHGRNDAAWGRPLVRDGGRSINTG